MKKLSQLSTTRRDAAGKTGFDCCQIGRKTDEFDYSIGHEPTARGTSA
jgi:hypothetical protein